MGKIFKALGIFIGVVLLLALAAVVVVPMVVDPNDFKEEIVKQVHEQTGRDLKIAGDLDLSVFPWLGVQIDGVELGNAKGFGATPFLSVRHAAVRVKLMPLIEKKLEVDAIELDGVALNLVKQKNGTSNLDDLAKGGKARTTKGAEQGESGPGLEGLTIGGINIKDARISWDDRQSGKKFEVSDFNLNSGAIVPGSPVKLSMGMRVQSKDPALNARVALGGTVELDQGNKQLNVRGLKVTLDADGDALPQGKLKAELKSTLLLALSGKAFALLDLKVTSGAFNLTGDVKGSNLNTDTPQVSAKIAAQLDDTNMDGTAVMSGATTKFKLNVDAIDLDRYLATDSGNSNTATGGEAGPGSGDEQLIPVDAIRGLNMNGTVTIGKLTVNKMLADKVELGLKAGNGVLETRQKIGGFSGGSYSGTVDINAQGNTPSLKLSSKLSGVRLETLIKELAGEDRISGEGNFNADLTASGNDINAIKRTLNGKLDFNLLKGAIKGINLAAELRKAKAMVSGKKAPKENGPVQTDFSQIKGSGVITNGVLNNKDLQAFSPFLRVTGEGEVNLVQETLDYTAKIFVVASSKGQGGQDLAGLEELKSAKVGVPVHFTGPLVSPKWQVKWDKVLLDSQKEELKSKLEEKLVGEEKKDGEEESDKDKLKRKLFKKLVR